MDPQFNTRPVPPHVSHECAGVKNCAFGQIPSRVVPAVMLIERSPHAGTSHTPLTDYCKSHTQFQSSHIWSGKFAFCWSCLVVGAVP